MTVNHKDEELRSATKSHAYPRSVPSLTGLALKHARDLLNWGFTRPPIGPGSPSVFTPPRTVQKALIADISPRVFKTVDFEMTLPSLRNSPTMRRAPQRGLFVFISIASWRTSSLVAGRPIGFCKNVHLRAASLRCQAITVLGFIVTMLSTTP
jgi:hypothetical protein